MTAIVIPVGSFEQHGPHLPPDTDTRIADHLARAVVARVSGLMLGPALTVTSSGEHSGFPNTLSIGNELVTQTAIELARSADWSSGIVFINGHGGNHSAIMSAIQTITYEGRRAIAWWPRVANGDAHAGDTETSIMLVIAPEEVRMDLAAPGNTEEITAILPRIIASGIASVSTNGVLGDPTRAHADKGQAILEQLIQDAVAAVKEWLA